MNKYFNREISWLKFNERVNELSYDKNVPILERLNFISIAASNLDEFFSVRVAGLIEQLKLTPNKKSFDGMKIEDQIKIVDSLTRGLIKRQNESYGQIEKELKKNKIYILRDKFLKKHLSHIKNYYLNEIISILTPITVDSTHPLPFIPNLSLCLIAKIKNKKSKKEFISVMRVSDLKQRFLKIIDKQGIYFYPVESIINNYVGDVFHDFDVIDTNLFRVIRDSDLEVLEEADDLIREFKKLVRERKRGQVIRLDVQKSLNNNFKSFIINELNVSENEIFEYEDLLGFDQLSEVFGNIKNKNLNYKKFKPRFPQRINDFGGDCFAAIKKKDLVVHHPFESFNVVVSFLDQASNDKNVVAIKQTLYRTSDQSPIIDALIRAAEAGKSVTAVVELKARFDEEKNLQWASNLEKAGVQVVYGFLNLKIHAKVSLVTRREKKNLVHYVHYGTGNYHPQTAKVYTDLSFFTCNKDLASDAIKLFHYMSSYNMAKDFKRISFSPYNLRQKLFENIDYEIGLSKIKKPANIWIKMNNLVDQEIINKLYEASQAGVKITCLIRGICCLVPGVKGMSENIEVKSIVGRFLEHSRVVCFGKGNKLPSKKAKIYISSADWMTRNFDRRVETLVPIDNKTVHEQILYQIMYTAINDNQNAWVLDSDGDYQKINSKLKIDSHKYFMTNPSLSGRGTAAKKVYKKIEKQ